MFSRVGSKEESGSPSLRTIISASFQQNRSRFWVRFQNCVLGKTIERLPISNALSLRGSFQLFLRSISSSGGLSAYVHAMNTPLLLPGKEGHGNLRTIPEN